MLGMQTPPAQTFDLAGELRPPKGEGMGLQEGGAPRICRNYQGSCGVLWGCGHLGFPRLEAGCHQSPENLPGSPEGRWAFLVINKMPALVAQTFFALCHGPRNLELPKSPHMASQAF